jgi:hypothetical protein
MRRFYDQLMHDTATAVVVLSSITGTTIQSKRQLGVLQI